MESKPWRAAVGGEWNIIGKLQFDFMVSRGLKPEHRFLDVGCGSLRGGVHFIPYLDKKNYWGIDKDKELIRCGVRKELGHSIYYERFPYFMVTDKFSLPLGVHFDFALAQSLFPHLKLDEIELCLKSVWAGMRTGGKFYATFFMAPDPPPNEIVQPIGSASPGIGVTTFLYRDPYHLPVRTFRWLAKDIGFKMKYIGDWGHPRGQMMLEFIKPHGVATPPSGSRRGSL